MFEQKTLTFPTVLLRDFFASQAMYAMLSRNYYTGIEDKMAISAYRFADAMMKQREVKNDNSNRKQGS